MVKNRFENLQGLISQYKNDSFEGFSIDVEDSRDFRSLIREGTIDAIDLFKTPDKYVNNLEGLDKWLKNRAVKVSVEGRDFFESRVVNADLRFGGSSESLKFDVPEGMKDAYKEFEGLANLNDLGRFLGIDDKGGTISFTPIEKGKEAVDKAEEKTGVNGKILLIVPVIGVVYLLLK